MGFSVPGGRSSVMRGGMRRRLTASAVVSLARWTPYLESEMCGLGSVVGPGSVCLDVGSAADLYTAVLSELAGASGRVHSIEPLPFAHLLWAGLLDARRAPNVRHHCLALGAEAGTASMSVPYGRFGLVTGRSYLKGGSGGPDSNDEFAGQVSVSAPVERLDDFCVREGIGRVDFVKIDVEGAELRVLEGGEKVIGACRPAMLVEIEARHTARYGHGPGEVAGWLLERGYVMHAWRRGWRRVDRVEEGTRNYLFRPVPGGPAA